MILMYRIFNVILDPFVLEKLLNVPFSTPKEAFYLELGILPIGVIIKARRVNFLHHLANLDQSEMLYKFFKMQWEHPVKSDWTEQTRQDLLEFDIPVSLNFLQSKSKYVFKNLVKSKVKCFELKKLLEEKATKSKLKDLEYTELKIQEYLHLKSITKEQAVVLFKFRTRMCPFEDNFKGGKLTTLCPFCKGHIDSQSESFTCTKMKEMITIEGNYSDIFGDHFQNDVIKTLQSIFNFREEYRKLI